MEEILRFAPKGSKLCPTCSGFTTPDGSHSGPPEAPCSQLFEEEASDLPLTGRSCGHCGTGPLVRDGSKFCSLGCRREAAGLGDEDAVDELRDEHIADRLVGGT